MRLLFALLIPLAAHAQLAMFAVNGSTETPVGSAFDFGSVAVGDSKDIQFRVRNTGNAKVDVTTLKMDGTGFSLPNKPSIPYTIAPGSFMTLIGHFAPGSNSNFSANFQVNSLSTLVYGSGVASATLSSGVGCTGPAADSSTIDFGPTVAASSVTCTYSLRNLNSSPIAIAAVAVTGLGFSGPTGVRAPLTLVAGESVTFTLTFAPNAPGFYSGLLAVDSKTYKLSGTGTAPALGSLSMDAEASAYASAQQRKLTLSLASAAPVDSSGNVTLTFTPDSASIQDDKSIVFAATSSRSLPYAITKGSTQVLLNGQPSAVFQTGSTAGRISFSASGSVPFSGGTSKTLVIPAQKIGVDSSFGSRRTGFLDVQVTGFDNTYTAGSMAFTFYDRNGAALDGGQLSADFRSAFSTYFAKQTAGSVFTAAISFPITGDGSLVGSVDVTLSNSLAVTTQRVTFP